MIVPFNNETKNMRLHNDHVLLNIQLPENDNGIINLSRDPRKLRLKPDAYVGIVEEVGSGCQWVVPGQKIVVERWIYLQQDVDDARIIAREIDILILGNDEPAPGVVVMKLIDQTPKSDLLIQNYRPKQAACYFGMVTHTAVPLVSVGEMIYIPRRDEFQYTLGLDRLVFRVVDNNSILLALTPEYSLKEVENV